MANRFNASEISIWNLLNNNSNLFNIPAYQRGYSWTIEEAFTLFEDLQRFSKNKINNQSYYIGNMILQMDNTERGTRRSVFNVVDGQQRMTTTLLIIAGLRTQIKNRIASRVGDREKLSRIILDLDRLLYFDSYSNNSDELQLKIYNKDYDKDMKAVIENTYNDETSFSNSKYLENYHYILTQGIQKMDSDDDFELFSKALENVYLVEVILSSDDNALVVFENINSKGHELTSHDLIKNYLYILSSYLPIDKRDVFDSEITRIFESKIKCNIKNEKELSTFWRLISSIIGNIKQPINKHKTIYLAFKESVRKKMGLSEKTNVNELEDKINKLLKIIETNFEIYDEIMTYNTPSYPLKERWERSLASISNKTFDSLAPILFKIFNDYKEGRITVEQRNQSIVSVNKYKIRLKLTYDEIKDLKNFSMSIVEYFNKDDVQKSFTRENFLDYLNNVAKDSKYRRNPDDINFKLYLQEKNIYNNDAAQEILIEYEYSLNKNEGIMADSKRKIQVEHIMPQTIYDKNKSKYYEGWDNVDMLMHAKFVHTIGNLTLTFDNQEMGNGSFDKKLKVFNDSNLRINNYFSDISNWDFDAIENRYKEMVDKILEQWKI